jgi:hypothetical protein
VYRSAKGHVPTDCLQHIIIPFLTSPVKLAVFFACRITVTLLSVAVLLFNRYHSSRVKPACRYGPCPNATCQAGLSVWAMSQCHLSGRPVGMVYVPVPRVRVAYRRGPCPSATCQTGLSVWAMFKCHVSGRPADVGHVPVPRVSLACRYGP